MTDRSPDVTASPPLAAGWFDDLFASLSRVTASGRLIPEIDGLRFVAIGLVVLVHVHHYVALARPGVYDPPPALDDAEPNPVLRAVNHGDVGVYLFFIISGFILALPFAEWRLNGGKPVSLGGYLLRRLTRLEPPYLLSLALLLPLTLVFSNRLGAWEAVGSVAASSVYLHGPLFGTKSAVNFVTWSLEVEVQFYLLLPLLARLYTVRSRWTRRASFATAAAGLVALQAVGLGQNARLALSVLNFGQYFLMGCLLADLFVTDWSGRPGRSLGWDLFWVATWPLVFALAAHPMGAVLEPVLLAGVFVAALRGRAVRWCLSCRWVVVVGGMCYSIYLLHVPTISLFGRLTMRWAGGNFGRDFVTQVAVLAVPIVVVSATYFVLFERPCMRRDWPQRLRAGLFGRGEGGVLPAAAPAAGAEGFARV